MSQFKALATSVSLSLLMTTSPALLPMRTVYADQMQPAPIQSLAPVTTAAAGWCESRGSVTVDGQPVESKLIEGGELFQAPTGAATRIALQGIGQVMLMGGTAVRLGASETNLIGELAHRALIASLLSGEILVKLDPEAGAYVQIGEAAFSAISGSSFRAGLREGRVVVETIGGTVRDLGNWAIQLPPRMSPQVPPQVIDAAAGSVLRERLLRSINSNPGVGPQNIGTVETMGTVTIDGRPTHGQRVIRSDELLQVPVNTSASVSLDAIGQLLLAGGTEARLTTSRIVADDPSQSPTLMATLTSGALVVKLDQKGSALIRAGGLTFTAFTGAQFRLGFRDGQVVIDPLGLEALGQPAPAVVNWTIRPSASAIEAASQAAQTPAPSATRRYVIRPLDLTTNLSVRARAAREIQYRVTDENDRPVPDVPVVIALGTKGGKSVGILTTEQARGGSVRVFADQQGIAKATFNAGVEPGSISITATVEGTSFATAGAIGVTGVAGFFAAATLIPVLATVAVGVTAGVVAAGKKDVSKELPVKLEGPQVVKP